MTHSYRKVSSEVPDLSALHQSSDKASGDDDTRPPQRLLPHATREVLKVVPLNNAGNEIEPDVFLQEKNPTSANEQIIQPGLNLINILRAPFLYKSALRSFSLVTFFL
jgi:hypothetical protein